MSEHEIVSAAQATIAALNEALAAAEARAANEARLRMEAEQREAKAIKDADELRALLRKLRTSLNETSNDPMEDRQSA